MKKFIYTLAVTLLGMMGCSEDTITYINPTPGEEPSGVTAELGISSKNTWFQTEDNLNAAIGFKSLGGEVVVDIQTNVAWKYTAVNADWLTIEKDDVADQLVLSCEGNKVEQAQQATVTITAGDKTATITASQNPYGTLEISASENNFQIPARGELTAAFEVLSTDEEWLFETRACTWLLVERDGNTVTLTLDPNEGAADRETTFELVAGKGGGNPVTETIRVTQDRAALITTSLKTLPFEATPVKAKEITVESNFEWEYTLTEGSDWLTVDRTDEGLKVSLTNNPDAASRSAAITITAGDGKANVAEQIVTVSQTGFDFDAFIIGLNVTATDLRARLPFDKEINATIDWGDGTIEENVTGTFPQHTYTDADYYVVSVKGSVPSINSSNINISSYNQARQVTEIYNWGRTGLTSMESALYQCTELKKIATDKTEAFADVTSFKSAFYHCDILEEIPEGFLDYAAKLKTVEGMFQFAYAVNKIPDALFHKCPALESVRTAFSYTSIEQVPEDFFAHNPELINVGVVFSSTKLKTVPEKLFASNPKIDDFSSIFSGVATLESIPENIFANQPECKSFYYTFQGTGLKTIPAKLFANNKKCTDFRSTFNGTKITSIPETLFASCPNVTTFMTCFSGCTELQSIPGDLFKNSGAFQSLATNAFNNIFKGCTSLTEIPAGLFDGFTTVTQFSSAFEGCKALTTLPSDLFATNIKVTSFANAFQNYSALKGIPEGLFRGLEKVTSFSNLFAGCTELEEIGGNIIDGCISCTSIASMFKGCTKLRTVSADAFAGAPKINSAANLFENCTALESVPGDLFAQLPALKTATSLFAGSGLRSVPAELFSRNPEITAFGKVFTNCVNLTSLPDGLFAANAKVTVYSNAFEGCTGLQTTGVLFGQSAATVKCDFLFAKCAALQSIPAGMFDGLAKASTFDQAFIDCAALETIPAGLFKNNTEVTTLTKCFQNCVLLKAVPAQLFGTSTKTKTLSYLFNGCTSLESIAPDAFSGLKAASTTFMYAFEKCTSLEEIPDGLLENNSTISTWTGMFRYCTGLRKVGSNVFNCGGSTTFGSVFDGCTALEEVGENLLVNAAKLTGVTSLFRDCSSLKSVPVNIFDECTKLKSVSNAFSGCTSLAGESPYTTVNGRKYHLYDRTTDNATESGLTALTSTAGCFKGCTQLTDYAQIPDIWKQ